MERRKNVALKTNACPPKKLLDTIKAIKFLQCLNCFVKKGNFRQHNNSSGDSFKTRLS